MKSFLQKSLKNVYRNMTLWRGVMEDDVFQTVTKGRVLFLAGASFFGFMLVVARLTDVMIVERRTPKTWHVQHRVEDGGVPRADIVDRHGVVLATHLVTASAYCDTHDVIDVEEAIQALHTVLTEVPLEELTRKLTSGKRFVWLARHLTPRRQAALQRLGLPGIYLKKDYKRVYPLGHLASHVVGFCDTDGKGLGGIERSFDAELASMSGPLKLSLDSRIQHIAAEVLSEGVHEYHAEGGNFILMDMRTGEILAMVSLPDFDPNAVHQARVKDFFNRNTLGVYEMGSVLKILNVAIALDTGKVTRHSQFDVREPVKIGRFTVNDFRGQGRVLDLEEAFLYSSNIASVKIAQQFGGAEVQRAFFKNFGVFDPVTLEIPETGRPIYSRQWSSATALSASYGYGIALSPLRLLTTVNGIVNGGVLIQPTLLYGKNSERKVILSPSTSEQVRSMMRRVVVDGSARRADVPGYQVFGKTGTAYKNEDGKYATGKARRTTFIGGLPLKNPRYLFVIMFDDPKPTAQTAGYATAGWNVAPYAGKFIQRAAPLLGIPSQEEPLNETKSTVEAKIMLTTHQETKPPVPTHTRTAPYTSVQHFLAKSTTN